MKHPSTTLTKAQLDYNLEQAVRRPHGHVHKGKLILHPDVFTDPDREINILISRFALLDCTAGHQPQTGQRISIEDMQSEATSLPSEILARLVEATELSDEEMINQVIKEVKMYNGALADGLTGLAEDFAYDNILALAEKAQQAGSQAKP